MLNSFHKMVKFVLLIAICASIEAVQYKDWDSRNASSLKELMKSVHGHGWQKGGNSACNEQRSYSCDHSELPDCSEPTKAMLLFPKHIEDEYETEHLFIAGLGCSGTCSISTPVYQTPDTVEVISNGSMIYTFNSNMLLPEAAGYSDKGILVDCDVPVNIEGFSYRRVASDVFTVLPVSALGREYVIPALDAPESFINTLFGITTLVNNTIVTVEVRTSGGLLMFDGSSYADGTTFNITLGALQTAQILCPYCDLSGTFITSSEPIAVLSGVDCGLLLNATLCDHMIEMIFPVAAYTNVFAIPFYPSAWFSGLIRIFAYQNTSVVVHSTNTITDYLQSYDFIEVTYNGTLFIESTSPVMVQLYGKNSGFTSGSFMMTVPGIDQYKSSYTFTVPDFGFNNFLSFVVKLEDKECIRLDGEVVDMSNEMISALNGTDYASFFVSVTPGYHVAEHTLGESFGLFVIGYKYANVYGFTPL